MICAPIAKVPCRVSSSRVVISSFRIYLTLRQGRCNGTAAYHLMKQAALDQPPCTVTADYAIKLRRPTPTDKPIELRARVLESNEDRATVEGELIAHDKVTATCRGTFVAVKPGHPAYHRW